MKIFIIGPVRLQDKHMKIMMESYVEKLEAAGHEVHLPSRDTNQEAPGLDICKQNVAAIEAADEVHIFYNIDSQGSHFDMGAAFALHKKLVIAATVEYGEGKSFPRMLDEWQKEPYVRHTDDEESVESRESDSHCGGCACGSEDGGG